jgi:P27 family predicted phage terminase small subunit
MPNPPKPEHLKQLYGTARKDRQRAAAAGDRLTEPPDAPSTLSAGARAEWHALAPILVEMETLCRGDLRALEQLAETLATQRELQAVIEAEGVLLQTAAGGYKTNPAMRSLETARNQAKALFIEFGLTPKARSYVSPAPKAKPDNDDSGPRPIPR